VEWAAGAQALGLLRGALDAGVAAVLEQQPRRVEELSALTGRSVAWLRALCRALEAHGVVVAADAGYALTASFAAMLASDAQQPLDGLLAGVDARVRHLALGGSAGGGFSALPSADRVAIAGALGLSPFSREGRAIFARVGASIPALGDRWSAGADHLELGCGVGNALLSFALEFPRLRAVGVEIDAALVAEARRRAGVLGLEDRVRVRHLDAAQLDDQECFDTAQWSQLFFPAATRRAVLLALRRALRPGGVVVMPTLPTSRCPRPPAASSGC
jgi:SAM-dependent methyltransferase